LQLSEGDGGAIAVHINSSGNVGIGTTSPIALPVTSGDKGLSIVNTTSNRAAVLELSGISGANYGPGNPTGIITFGNDEGGSVFDELAQIRAYATNSDVDTGALSFYTATNGTLANAMTIDYTGYVGIGTTGPSYKLDVAGIIRTTGYLIAVGDVGVAPIQVTSTTVCTNLNADLLDGQHGSYYSPTTHNHDHGTLTGLSDDDHSQYALLSGRDNQVLVLDRVRAYDAAGLILNDSSGSGGLTIADGGHVTVNTYPLTINIGTESTLAPIVTNSSVVCTNLNSDYLDGYHASAFALLAGRAGGQTVIGATGSGENLTLQSTSHATKGKIFFGSDSVYDEVNNRWGFGTTSPGTRLDLVTGNITARSLISSTTDDYTSISGGSGPNLGANMVCYGQSHATLAKVFLWRNATTNLMKLDGDANLSLGGAALGTSAAKVLGIESGTAPSTAPANLGQMWVEDINGAAGYAGLHKMTETTAQKEIVPGVIIKATTGSPSNPYEGLMEINTFDNKVRMYADAGWRELVSW
jgi:hypothetical protein